MDTLGDKLRAARVKKKATTSEAAAATRIKIQHIEAMEKNDFERIPAATYARGFIKLYAEYLGLPAAPLVKEYVDKYMPRTRQSIVPGDDAPQRPGQKPLITNLESHVQDPEPAHAGPSFRLNIDFGRIATSIKLSLLKLPVKRIAAVVAVLAVVSLLSFGVSRCVSTAQRAAAERPVAQKNAERPRMSGGFVKDPPEPYLTASPNP